MDGRRRRLDVGSWPEVFARFDAGPASVVEFCAREGLSTSSFYRWRERLGQAGFPPAVVPGVRAARPAAAVAPGFIELGDLAGATPHAGSRLQLRLELGGGLVLQITRP